MTFKLSKSCLYMLKTAIHVLLCLLLFTSETDIHMHSTHISPYSDLLKWTFTQIIVHFFSLPPHTQCILALILCMYVRILNVSVCAAGMIMVLFRFPLTPLAFTYLNFGQHYKGLHHVLFSGSPQHMKTNGNWATSSSRYPKDNDTTVTNTQTTSYAGLVKKK